MGSGAWTASAYDGYSKSVGRTLRVDGTIDGKYSAQEMYTARGLESCLNPYRVVRECRDSAEHPETIPVILALDVTGSMGDTAVEIAKKLNIIMTNLYEKVKDVEFMVMGIGDFAYDKAPLQASQFESDIRVAEQLDKIYFEGHGGGNAYESYTAAWYFGATATDLDCWKRGKRGVIITMGDECLNPYLPDHAVESVLGTPVQNDVNTNDAYNAVKDKYDLYHIVVDTATSRYMKSSINESWSKYLDGQHLLYSDVEGISQVIVDIVSGHALNSGAAEPTVEKPASSDEGISW